MELWLESVHSDGTASFVSNPTPALFEDVTIRLRMYEDAPWYGAAGRHACRKKRKWFRLLRNNP